ncbi:hypothetical protein pipiens_008873 [Culex pipiens pipiens]|uniref:Translation initiation factor eIF2B subunit epsilon n=1 Tax=Culex pipiens pipiens TaxID=38569 RepID=A0ABD1DFU5_CULPP
MNQLDKKEPVQAILIADSFNDCFVPFSDRKPLSLLPLVNVPLVDYALESLNRSGVEEVIVFCSAHVDQVRGYIRSQQQNPSCSWNVGMTVSIVSSEGCRCMGDALRDLDAKGLVRGNFILTGVDTLTNANLAAILEEHKRVAKTDKGAAMTVVYKEGVPDQRTGNEVMIAMEKNTRRLLFHQRLNPKHKERKFTFPMEIILENKEVTMWHGLIDPQIAICSNTALPLFSDNFDFLTRDDFVRGLLINEEILASTIYVAPLPAEEYALRVNNWHNYQIASRDVTNRFVYPLVPDMGICGSEQLYSFSRNNIYRHRNIRLARRATLESDVVIGEKCEIDEDTVVAHSVLGKGCKIGKNCQLRNCFLLDGVQVEDNCVLNHCIIAENVILGPGCNLTEGCVLGPEVVLPKGMTLAKMTLQSTKPDDDWSDAKPIAEHAFTVPDETEGDADEEPDSDAEDTQDVATGYPMRLGELPRTSPESIYSMSSEEDESRAASPLQDDANIFLSEVLESLKRGFSEKSNPEYLILEINSSRYAYNMALSEVNFFVVKAILQLTLAQEGAATALVSTLAKLLGYFGPVFKNYIRGQPAMLDCLKALEEVAAEEPATVGAKIAAVVHFLYEKDYVAEEAILEWHGGIDEEDTRKALAKLVEWLNQSSEEEEESDDE